MNATARSDRQDWAAHADRARPRPSRAVGGTGPGAGDRRTGQVRLTRRGRLVIWCLAVMTAAGAGLGAQSASAGGPADPIAVSTHTVAPGETLWEIARGIATPAEDVRDVIRGLQELNGLRGASLQAGQQLLVPVR